MRDFRIEPGAMIRARFGPQVTPANVYSGYASEQPSSGLGTSGTLYELGLAEGPIKIMFHHRHDEIHVNDFGGSVPADLMANGLECSIRTNLIHWDERVLQACVREAMAGGLLREGRMPGTGGLLGGGLSRNQSGYRYVGLVIELGEGMSGSPVTQRIPSYLFPAATLSEPPVEYPIGVDASVASLTWRAIPYAPMGGVGAGSLTSGSLSSSPELAEVYSSGAVLWTRTSWANNQFGGLYG